MSQIFNKSVYKQLQVQIPEPLIEKTKTHIGDRVWIYEPVFSDQFFLYFST